MPNPISKAVEAFTRLANAVDDWSRPTGANGMTSPRDDHPLLVANREARTALRSLKAQGEAEPIGYCVLGKDGKPTDFGHSAEEFGWAGPSTIHPVFLQAPPASGWNEALEAAARLIEEHSITFTNAESGPTDYLAKRREGDTSGIQYAAAIRSLTRQEEPRAGDLGITEAERNAAAFGFQYPSTHFSAPAEPRAGIPAGLTKVAAEKLVTDLEDAIADLESGLGSYRVRDKERIEARDRLIAALLAASEPQGDGWRDIEEHARDSFDPIIRWHSRFDGPMVVRRSRDPDTSHGMPWVTLAYDHCWPEDSFLPVYLPASALPTPPAPQRAK